MYWFWYENAVADDITFDSSNISGNPAEDQFTKYETLPAAAVATRDSSTTGSLTTPNQASEPGAGSGTRSYRGCRGDPVGPDGGLPVLVYRSGTGSPAATRTYLILEALTGP